MNVFSSSSSLAETGKRHSTRYVGRAQILEEAGESTVSDLIII